MERLWVRLKHYCALMTVLGLLATGLALGCARGGGHGSSSSETSSTSETPPGTGTVVITGRIL
jgi:hypothetical protein